MLSFIYNIYIYTYNIHFLHTKYIIDFKYDFYPRNPPKTESQPFDSKVLLLAQAPFKIQSGSKVLRFTLRIPSNWTKNQLNPNHPTKFYTMSCRIHNFLHDFPQKFLQSVFNENSVPSSTQRCKHTRRVRPGLSTSHSSWSLKCDLCDAHRLRIPWHIQEQKPLACPISFHKNSKVNCFSYRFCVGDTSKIRKRLVHGHLHGSATSTSFANISSFWSKGKTKSSSKSYIARPGMKSFR